MACRIFLFLFFLLPTINTFSQDTIYSSSMEAKLDSILTAIKETDVSQIDLYNRSMDTLEIGSKVIDWTALIFGAFTLIFLVAGIIGFRELTVVRNLRSQMSTLSQKMQEELQTIEKLKKEIQEDIESIKVDIKKESKDFLKTIYLLNEGISNYHNGKLKDAERRFKEILNMNRNDYEATCYLARCYFGQNQYNLALDTIEKAIHLHESPGEAYYIMGENYRRLGDYDKSIEAFSKSVKVFKKPGVYSSLGYTYFKKGNIDDAIEAFKDALNLKRYSTPTCGLAKCYLKKQQPDKAKRYIEETIFLAEDEISSGSIYVWPLYNLAFSYLLKNQRNECLDTLKLALDKNPNKEVIKDPFFDFKALAKEDAPGELLSDCIDLIEKKLSRLI